MVHKQENIPGSAWGGGVCLEGWCLPRVVSGRGGFGPGGVLPREVSACGGGGVCPGECTPLDAEADPHCMLGYTPSCPLQAGITPPCPFHAGIHPSVDRRNDTRL